MRNENRRHDISVAQNTNSEVTKTSRQPSARLIERRPSFKAKKAYEVEEVIDDIPNVHASSHQKRPRIITETKFEAVNAPKSKLFEPAPSTTSESPQELLKTFGSIANKEPETLSSEKKAVAIKDATEKTLLTSESPDESTSATDDASKVPTESLKEVTSKSSTTITTESSIIEDRQLLHARESSPIVQQDTRRTNFRSRNRSSKTEEQTHPPRIRVRGRPSRLEEPQSEVTSRPITRTRAIKRQHPEVSSVRNVPSVFTSEAEDTAIKSRAERRVSKHDDNIEYDYLIPSTSRRHITRTTPLAAAKRETTPRSTSRKENKQNEVNNAANSQRRRTPSRTESRSAHHRVSNHKEIDQVAKSSTSSRQITRTTPSVTTKRETTPRSSSRRNKDNNELDHLVKSTSQRYITKTTPTGTAKHDTTAKPITRRGGAKFQLTDTQSDNQIIDQVEVKNRNRNGSKPKSKKRQGFDNATPQVRSRSRNLMADIDESKIEVLPLFETNSEAANIITGRTETAATKITEVTKKVDVNTTPIATEKMLAASTSTIQKETATEPTRRTTTRVESSSVRVSSTRRDVTSRATTENPSKNKTRTTRRQKRRKSTSAPNNSRGKTNVKRRQTSTEAIPTSAYTTTTITKPKLVERRQTTFVETQTTPSILIRSTPNIRETVKVTESEVVSTRKITKSQLQKNQEENLIQKDVVVKVDDPIVTVTQVITRGNKKDIPEVKKSKSSLSSSEEDIDEEDNYPEPFKALIQEKKASNVNIKVINFVLILNCTNEYNF